MLEEDRKRIDHNALDPDVHEPTTSSWDQQGVRRVTGHGLPDSRVSPRVPHPERSSLEIKEAGMRRLLTLAPIAALFTACEDAGNSGSDNLLTEDRWFLS
jgi:hypothetical protein